METQMNIVLSLPGGVRTGRLSLSDYRRALLALRGLPPLKQPTETVGQDWESSITTAPDEGWTVRLTVLGSANHACQFGHPVPALMGWLRVYVEGEERVTVKLLRGGGVAIEQGSDLVKIMERPRPNLRGSLGPNPRI